MIVDHRRLAVALSGFCAFLNLYSPQALLPELTRQFGESPAATSVVMYAGTLAVALTAPLTGAIADVLGRKRVIVTAMFAVCVPMLMVATAPGIPGIAAWRFVQGLFLPPIFAVIVAYIGDEWPPGEIADATGIYVMGASAGGFSGRMIPGLLTDLVGWRAAFVVLAAITFLAAIGVATMLPRERKFVRSVGLAVSLQQMLRHLRQTQLVATFAVGFGTLFNFVATFTYVSFLLAAPPYGFSNAGLAAIFLTYVVGAVAAPWTGRLIARFGRRSFMLCLIATWMTGALITTLPHLAAIALGLVVCATCGLVCQTISTGYVTMIAKQGRSSAVGLYVTFFYIGGSAGAFFPGLAWSSGGWPATVAMLVAVQAMMAAVVASVWPRQAKLS
jgi:MFS transporter, YNFM family, putative membrane transport protein